MNQNRMADKHVADVDDFSDPLSNYEPAVYGSELERSLAEETVDAILSKPYVQIDASTPISIAMQTLHRLNVSSLLVVEAGVLVGIFTERDVLERVSEQYELWEELPVRLVMTAKPLVVYECDPVGTALAAIAAAGYRHVPVLSMSDEIVGIVSPRRVFEFLESRFD